MPHVFIEEENANEVAKTAKSKEKQTDASRAIISFVLIIIVIGLIAGIIALAHKISQKTQELGKDSGRSGGNKSGELSIPKPSTGMALPGVGGGGSVSSSGTPQNPAASAAPEGMLAVPAGEYIKGWDDTGAPVKISVPAFYMDKYEVTNRQYADFVKATNHKPPTDPRGPKYSIWKNGSYPAELADHPVVDVSYGDAEDYAKWVGKRLPTEEEWERASRGNEGFIYPWGNDYNPDAANSRDNRQTKRTTAPVGSFSYDRSPFGIFDMAGNVREWTSTPYSSGSQHWKVVKGGSFDDGADGLSSYAQSKGTMPAPNLGFRCVK